ncbi:hypothetical protein [Acetobacterium sp. KB-1]|jgi:hypothetical protein|uniref:hypothetical protein n=1 Tax=Acetobacterium sp. KB-1 TaxID=2184575 RepID=UPI000DBEBCC9|nr:hypothetical protein [Acetobacterium sp. KB-1]AWW26991.1 hypothetical protein DOZ58_10310 [Acetobacterium sp. KB-1]
MNKEEMKAVLVRDLEYFSDRLIEEQRINNITMINLITSRCTSVINFSVNIKIISLEEAEELEKAYDLI